MAPSGIDPAQSRSDGEADPGRAQRSKTTAAQLLERMRTGDRAAAAEFVVRYGRQIRRRIRSRLDHAVRSVYDSEDLLLTIARRLDEIVLGGRLRARSVPELWALVNRIGYNTAADRNAAAGRESRAATATARGVEAPPQELDAVDRRDQVRVLIERSRRRLEPYDRRLLLLRAGSRTLREIARSLGMAVPAVRNRWKRIRRIIRGEP